MRAKLLPDLKWSKWCRHEFVSEYFSWLGTWREATRPDHHKAEIWRYACGGKTLYEAYVMAGPCGETEYLREQYSSALRAREAVERAVMRALSDKAMLL